MPEEIHCLGRGLGPALRLEVGPLSWGAEQAVGSGRKRPQGVDLEPFQLCSVSCFSCDISDGVINIC